jgi:hypothetical protein
MAEHDKAPSLVVMIGAARPSPWAKEGSVTDQDEDDLGHEEHDGHGNADKELTHDGGADANSLIHLYHGLKDGDARTADCCTRLIRCLQAMLYASHNRNENALRHWTREAASVCDEIDSMGEGHDD